MQIYSARLRAALWWIVPLVALAITIGWETDWGRGVETMRPLPAAVAPTPVTVALLPEYTIAGGPAARTETVERTLFNPTRRPAPVLAQEVAQAKMQRGQFALTGTTVADGKSTAFLREATGKSRRVQTGDSINGLKVAEVRPDRVRLTLGDESEEIILKVASNPRPVAPPAAAPGALGSVPQPAQVPTPVFPTAPQVGQDTAQTLAERRRAARAAQSGQDGGATPAGGASAAAVPALTGAPPAPTTPDPRWQEVYRRYQQQQQR